MNDTARPMLLCVDMEAGSEALMAQAGERARRCAQGVYLLSVVPAAIDGMAREARRRRLQAWVARHLGGVEVLAVELETGEPEGHILRLAGALQADPVVLGRRRRSTVERIYVGSTTSQVISLCTRPVLVVPVEGA